MSDDKWTKLEEVLRRVIREEIAALGKQKIRLGFEHGRWTGVTEEQMEAWKAAYGSVDIDSELKKMAAWIVSNPALAPKSNFARFINTWLTRTQNQASLRSIPTERERKAPPNLCEYCMAPAVGAINGRRHCRQHGNEAMDGVHPQKYMAGVTAKAVAGND